MANVYKSQGQADKWLATLEEVLRQEDNALDHADVRDTIAREFMKQKKYKEAMPYADAAAESGAAWAMITASSCHEMLGEWEEAEQWIRATSERYDDCATHWFYWCKRTERGDVKAASAVARPQLAILAQAITNPKDDFAFGSIMILANEPGLALARTKRSVEAKYDAPLALRLAVLADATGDADLRDRTITLLLADTRKVGPITRRTLTLMRDWLARPEAEKVGPDLAKVDAILAAMPEGRGDIAYLVAQFLDNHGREDDATAYLAIAAAKVPPETTDERNRILARSALRDRGLDPDKAIPRPIQGR